MTVTMRNSRTNGLTVAGMCIVKATNDLTESSKDRGVMFRLACTAVPANAALFNQMNSIRKTVSSTYKIIPASTTLTMEK